jgi:hypothetical protein
MQIFFLVILLFINCFHTFSQINPGVEELQKTGIPIIEIAVVNNLPITSKENYLKAKITTYYSSDGVYKTQVDSTEIKGRGNTSWTDYPKKPYRLKLFSAKSMLGMPSNRHWALIANYIDRTLIRNKTAYDLSRYFGLKSASRSEFVHLILNTQYLGVYQFTEVIKIGKDRVDIDVIKSSNGIVQGGVILEVTDIIDELYNFNSDLRNVNFSVKDPDDLNTGNSTEAQKRLDYVKNILNKAESSLFSDDFQDTAKGYNKYFDINSLVNWYLLEELFRNIDAEFRRSVYMYIDTKNSNKITMGPVWDFDISSGVNTTDPNGYWIKEYEGHWYSRLFEDSTFKKTLKSNWQRIRSSIHKELYGIINSSSRKIYEGQKYNFEKWEYIPFEHPLVVFENHDQEIFYFKKYLKERIEWLDREFEYTFGNLPPITSDLHFKINEDENTTLQLISSGKKSESDYFEITKLSSNATLNLDKKTGTLIYKPSLNFYGNDTLSYRFYDGEQWSDTSYLYLQIEAINDQPEVLQIITDTLLEDNTYAAIKSKGLFSNIIDPDDFNLKIDSIGSLKLGNINIQNDGSFNYTPLKNINGFDTLHYTITNESNQTVAVNRIFYVVPVNDAPELYPIQKTIEEDSQLKLTVDKNFITDPDDSLHILNITKPPTNGKLNILNGNQLTYLANQDYYGVDSFKIRVKDSAALSNENTVTVTISPVEDRPISIKDLFYQVKQGNSLNLKYEELLSAVYDPDGDTLKVLDFIDNEQQLLVRKNYDGITVSTNKFTLGVIKKKVTITDYHSNPIETNLILRVLPDLNQSNFESIKIFPNPTSGNFTIEDLQIDFLIIYNSEGKVCLEKRLDESNRKNSIQINHLNKGTYRIVLYDKKNIIAIKSLILI